MPLLLTLPVIKCQLTSQQSCRECINYTRTCKFVQVVVKAPITHRGGFEAKPPTVMLHLNKDFEVGGDGPSKQHPDSLEAIPSGSAGRLVRLSPLNCVSTIGHSVCQAFSRVLTLFCM